MLLKVIYLIIIIDYRISCIPKKYTNYTLYRAIPLYKSDIEYFLKLDERYDVNFWREPGMVYYPIEFVINPKDRQNFLNEAQELGIYCTELMDDVQSAFEEQTITSYARHITPLTWDDYYHLDDIYIWLTNLSKTFPQEVELQNIGQTYEKRQILAVKVVLQGSKMRSTVIIEGGIHAREWISPAFVTYLINSIVHSRTSEDANLKRIALTYEWYFVPVLNPDGYVYTFTEDRLWRKNRNDDDGVDLNRNFAHAHGTVGVSWNPQSNTYCGPKAFSERESIAMANLVKAKQSNLEYYVTFHSYGQYIIISYGSSMKHLDNYDEVYKMCAIAAKRIRSKYTTIYHYGTGFETVGYLTSGASSCWVKQYYHVPYVISFELRDDGHQGFALDRSKILPTCTETLDGLLSFLTPRKENFTKIWRSSGQSCKMLDKTVIVVNFLLVIKAC